MSLRNTAQHGPVCTDAVSFNQFDSGRQGQLSYLDLERLLEKDATVEAREDCVKMVSGDVLWVDADVLAHEHLRHGPQRLDQLYGV